MTMVWEGSGSMRSGQFTIWSSFLKTFSGEGEGKRLNYSLTASSESVSNHLSFEGSYKF